MRQVTNLVGLILSSITSDFSFNLPFFSPAHVEDHFSKVFLQHHEVSKAQLNLIGRATERKI